MKTEYEVRILEIDKQIIIEKLEVLGAKKIGEFLYRRYVYDVVPKEKGKWIRLRTNGKKTTLTYKDIVSNTIDGTKEVEITVDDFDAANEFLERIGFKSRSYQENKRLQYKLDGVEIDIDSWPMIPPYMEIEGKSIYEVNSIIKKLDIEQDKIITLNCDDIYREIYKIDISTIEELKF